MKLKFSLWKSYSLDYNVCLKWPSFSRTRVCSQTRHCRTASMMSIFDKMLLKVVDTLDPSTVDMSLFSLQHASSLVVDRVKFWLAITTLGLKQMHAVDTNKVARKCRTWKWRTDLPIMKMLMMTMQWPENAEHGTWKYRTWKCRTSRVSAWK